MAFLDEIGHRQAVVPEAGRQGDHKAHVRCGQLVKSSFVALLFPAHGQQMLFFPLEKRSIHGGADEPATNPRDFSHCVLPWQRHNERRRKKFSRALMRLQK